MINKEIELIKNIILDTVNAEKIYLFGSYAYGEPDEDSDYDFYVVIPDSAGRPLEVTQSIYRALRGIQRKPIDVLVGYSSNFEKRSELPTIERTIRREGVILFEHNRFGKRVV